jgi:hypothetical protein
MTTDSAHRGVRLERIENSTYVVTNDRGGQIRIGRGEGTDFTAVDLLLTAIGGCKARMATRPGSCYRMRCGNHMTGCARCRGPWNSARP